jgi:hypothetical protein
VPLNYIKDWFPVVTYVFYLLDSREVIDLV